jgi:predicted nucleic acid-binding protein
MRARPLLADRDRVLVDVNCLAIFLVEDHPGHEFVAREMEKGLSGQFIPLLLDVVPMRAYWIMTRQWSCDPSESEKALRHFLDAYPLVEYCQLGRALLHHAFDLARELRHDPYDTTYLAGALEYRASGIMTTDTDFRRLCQAKNLDYVNPVPVRVLEKFAGWKLRAELKDRLVRLDRALKEVPPARKGFAAKSVREDRESH